jgi:hypothetical protein
VSDFEINLEGLEETVAHLNLGADKVDDATEAGVVAVTELGERQAGKQVGHMYKRRIPTRREVAEYNRRKKGRSAKRKRTGLRQASNAPAWTRKGHLQTGITASFPNRRTGVLDVQGPAEPYAKPRHDLNKPGALGIVRHDPFFEDTERIIEPQAPEVFQNAFLNELDI